MQTASQNLPERRPQVTPVHENVTVLIIEKGNYAPTSSTLVFDPDNEAQHHATHLTRGGVAQLFRF